MQESASTFSASSVSPSSIPSSVSAPSGAEASGGAFSISLDFFSGPMDLLLHLVHQQEVDISKVSMRLIAEQYLAVVSRARFLDLEKAAEYLVIAATLLSIKSSSLLPNAAAADDSLPEEGSEQFYEELRARLRAYELTKSRARALTAMPQLGVDTFSRLDRRALLPTPEMLAEPEEATSLALLFGRLLKRIGGAIQSYRIRLEPISIVSFMMKIVDTLGQSAERSGDAAATPSTGSFRQLVRNFKHLASSKEASSKEASSKEASSTGTSSKETSSKGAARSARESKGVLIGSFIAVLELVKRGFLHVSQDSDGADIQLELTLAQYGAINPDITTSEFDSAPEAGAADSGKIVPFPGASKAGTPQANTSGSEDEIEEEVMLKEANTRGDF